MKRENKIVSTKIILEKIQTFLLLTVKQPRKKDSYENRGFVRVQLHLKVSYLLFYYDNPGNEQNL